MIKLTAVQRRLLNEADYDFRQAERQAATGGADEKAKLLNRQLRVGQITRERVIFLSRLGYEPARVLYPEEEPLTFLNQFSDPMHVSTRAYSIANSATPDALRESGLEVEELVNFAADCAEEVLPSYTWALARAGNHRALAAALAAAYAADAAGAIHPNAAAHAADAAGAIHPNAAAHAVDQALIAGLDKSWASNRLIQYLLGEV